MHYIINLLNLINKYICENIKEIPLINSGDKFWVYLGKIIFPAI